MSSLDKEMRRAARLPRPKVDPIFRGAPSTPLQIKESFNWMTPEWKSVRKTKKQVQIKGVALTSNIVSKNKRKYLDEELKMAARTLTGKAINVNHSDRQIVGNVIHAEYENGAIEYLGVVKKEPYVTMLKEKDPRITGVSVQASYLHNKCSVCGERFFSEKAFKAHMLDEHAIKNGVEEVHGILFDGLSLVLSPEVPGVETTSLEVMETDASKTQRRLFETYLKERGFSTVKEEQNKMKLGEPKDEHGCEPDEVWDPETQTCVKKAAEQAEGVTKPQQADIPTEEPLPCPEGQHRDPITGGCVDDEPAQVFELQRRVRELEARLREKEDFNVRLNEIDEAYKKYKHVMEKKLARNIEKLPGMLRDLDQRITALESQPKQQTLAETTALEKRITALENHYSHIRGTFKGQHKSLKTLGEVTGNLDKAMRESAKRS